jgi:hypothetical protein
MKNRILYLSRSSIPYIKELMPLAKSISGCLIMQQLDFWFEQKPDGFYKFMSPCDHSFYKEGDSWVEELGMSIDQFRTNFERIGVRYSSKKNFDAAEDKFQGMYYCSYTDKRAGLTYWFRNHELLDKALDELVISGNHPNSAPNTPKTSSISPSLPRYRESPSTGDGQTQSLGHGQRQSLGERVSQPHDIGKVSLLETEKVHPGITETTNKDFQKPQLQGAAAYFVQLAGQVQEKRGSGARFVVSESLIFPTKTTAIERDAVIKKLAECEPEYHQQILDEIEGNIHRNTLKSGIVPLCSFLVEASRGGQFEPRVGIEILALRESEQQITQAGRDLQRHASETMRLEAITEEMLNNLPPNIRKHVVELQEARKA